MIKHYAKAGESFFETLPEGIAHAAGAIEMRYPRPAPHFVASESGEWVEPEDSRDFKHFTGQAKLELFTEDEQTAIFTAAFVNLDMDVMKVYERFKIADYLTYSDERTRLGLELLEVKGLITPARHQEIIAVMTAERQS